MATKPQRFEPRDLEPQRPTTRQRLFRLLWFIGLWLASVIAVGLAAGALRLLFGTVFAA